MNSNWPYIHNLEAYYFWTAIKIVKIGDCELFRSNVSKNL